VLFGLGIYVHKNGPRGSLPWLMIVLFSAWIGQLVGKQLIDATLSGFIGAAVMVPVAHAVAHVRHAPPAHVMFLPAFWLLVPGTIGLIGVTELVGDNAELGSANLGAALAAIPSVALGILVGTMIVRAARLIGQAGVAGRRIGRLETAATQSGLCDESEGPARDGVRARGVTHVRGERD
jgi:uncharacterized membrane protein YjjB (DUF3815 family)